MFGRPFFNPRASWRDMERLRREMNRLFAPADARLDVAPDYPAMNIWTNDEGAIVTAELPGFDPEHIDITVEGNTLQLAGSRQPYEPQEGEAYHRRERGYGGFNRAFQLPFDVEPGEVEATFDKGVLHITLPRAEADKPKKITVKTG